MKRSLSAVLAVSLGCTISGAIRADEKEATAILDKAIKAMGGEEKLGKVKCFSLKSKGTLTIMGNDSDFTSSTVHEGLDRLRSEFSGKFGDNEFKAVAVIDGDKGWGKINDMDAQDMDEQRLKDDKRRNYLQVFSTLPGLAKSKGFKIDTAGEEKVGDKPAAVVTVTGPDGQDCKLFFDKESGLLVKQVANVPDFGGGAEFTQESTYADYKDFDGIKKATKMEVKRDGEKLLSSELVEFKVLDKADAGTFTAPK